MNLAREFWILDFGFWIEDSSRPMSAIRSQSSNPKSKIQNPKFTYDA
jgi:hypothetical protein